MNTRKRVLVIGEGIKTPTGFGGQLKKLVNHLRNANDVFVIELTGVLNGNDFENVTTFPVVNLNIDEVNKIVRNVNPDVVIIFHCPQIVYHLFHARALFKKPVYIWMPWEGVTLPEPSIIKKKWSCFDSRNFIHLTNYSYNLWGDVLPKANTIIPHGIDTTIFNAAFPVGHKKILRERYSKKLRFPIRENDIVIVNTDRNEYRKRWDLVYDYIRKLSLYKTNVLLIAHTKVNGEGGDGVNKVNLKQLETTYGIESKVVYTDFDWLKSFSENELAELYQLSDFRISMSMGEGFSIPSIEAAACGCLNIVPYHTAFKEVCDYLPIDLFTEISGHECRSDILWGIPSVESAVENTVKLISDEALRIKVQTDGIKFVKEKYSLSKFQAFERIINQENELLPERYFGPLTPFMDQTWLDLTEVCVRLLSEETDKSLVDIGCGDGDFINVVSRYGINCKGLEPEKEWILQAPTKVRKSITHLPFDATFPKAKIAVCTDALSRLGIDEKRLSNFVNKLSAYQWLLLDFVDAGQLIKTDIDKEKIAKMLTANGMTRRTDLEHFAKTNAKVNLQHQIWQSDGDTKYIPQAFASKHYARVT